MKCTPLTTTMMMLQHTFIYSSIKLRNINIIFMLLLYNVSCVLEFGIEYSHGYIPFPSISYFTTKLKPLFQYDWFHIVLQSRLNATRLFSPSHTTYKSKSQLKHSFDTLNCNISAMTLWFWLNQSAFPVNTTWRS